MNLMYNSTRNKKETATASQAILKGLASDGGLFVPEAIPALDKDIAELANMSYQEVAYEVMKLYMTDFTEEELKNCINRAYDSKFDTTEIAPLVKKDGLPEKAREIINDLKFHFNCQYDEKDSIGKRYRRQDAIGTPYCITVDHQTLEDGCVTLRNRDTMEQERVAISDLNNIIADKVSITSLLKTLL